MKSSIPETGTGRIKAAIALLGVAACVLGFSPHPPADPVWGRVVALVRASRQGLAVTSWGLLGLAFLTMGVLLVVVFGIDRFHRRKRQEDETHEPYREPKRLKWGAWVVLIGLALLAVAAIAFILTLDSHFASTMHIVEPPSVSLSTVSGVTPGASAASTVPSASALLSSPATLLALVAMLFVATAIAAFRLRRQVGTQASPGPAVPDPFSSALSATRLRLQLHDEVRNAVIACYADMCQLFAEEPDRIRNLTAREFETRLRNRGALETEISTLTSVFEKARYSKEECTEADRACAVEALWSLERRYKGRGQ